MYSIFRAKTAVGVYSCSNSFLLFGEKPLSFPSSPTDPQAYQDHPPLIRSMPVGMDEGIQGSSAPACQRP